MLNYQSSGVNIDAGNKLIDTIKPIARATHRSGVLSGLGGFGALFELPINDYKQPILVAGTDGVGTKLALAEQLNKHDSIGIDLVAMCVNDLIVQGAQPLFFLDYYATGKLNVDLAAAVIEGIAKGCQQANCALIGGETAEMPGMYQGEQYDLAGFCVGIVEKDQLIDGTQVKAGNSMIAIASSGPHSNGFSLIRHVLKQHPASDEQLNTLLTPTKIYVNSILTLLKTVTINAISHITGGGLLENIPRVLPADLGAVLDRNSWTMPDIFQWLQQCGGIKTNEMHRVFNCGVGLVVIVDQADTDKAIATLNHLGEQAWCIGHIETNHQHNVRFI